MSERKQRTFLLIFLLVLAPIGAVVVISALLLFGVRPALVFAPGHAVIAAAKMMGFRAPKPVGVITTGLAWWAAIAVVGWGWEKTVHRRRSSME